MPSISVFPQSMATPKPYPAGSASNNGTDTRRTENAKGLSDEETRQLSELRDRDREVRAHEAAHLAAAGSNAIGGASLQLTRGPDGGLYATGGEVQIDISPVSGDPAATIRKAETIRRAALAPASPSPQDRRVADRASQMAMSAQMELAQQTRAKSHSSQKASAYSDANRNSKSMQFHQVA